eukprot:CAMPEP_0114508772 /NCGR_PEP_ID=MMETSP0109-20121206/12813_1 /TAXON_ID=29199 /ORGANISM="Chlorarachnion reptans, Strain CCCM449" /LENGTH=245 /DNA_ID=CAMNT_0001687797 /DNA_START=360 /DNA_END=1094 /DNA_ORIENTATION=+
MRRDRLLKEERRKVADENRLLKLQKEAELRDPFYAGVYTHRKDRRTGKVLEKHRANTSEMVNTHRLAMNQIRVKAQKLAKDIEEMRSTLHYASKPFPGQRSKTHVVFVSSREEIEACKRDRIVFDPRANMTRRQLRQQTLAYQSLRKKLKALRGLERKIARRRLKINLITQVHQKIVENGKVHYEFLGPIKERQRNKTRKQGVFKVKYAKDSTRIVESMPEVTRKEVRRMASRMKSNLPPQFDGW